MSGIVTRMGAEARDLRVLLLCNKVGYNEDDFYQHRSMSSR